MRRRRDPSDTLTESPRAAALKLLSRRDYTTAEIERRLAERGHEADAIAATIAALTSARLLDDNRVGAAFVRNASGMKGRGKLRIARELEARGVSRPLIRELTAGLTAEDEATAIARVLDRMRVRHPIDPDTRRRLFGRLLRRGFTADAIGKALKVNRTD